MPSLRSLLPAVFPRALRKRIYAGLAMITPAHFRPEQRLDRCVRKLTRETVYKGPFQGMKYVRSSIGSAYLPKLLGTYERELHGVIETMAGNTFDRLVNIGAAEGYYAIGLARKLPKIHVFAFERNPEGRAAVETLARVNGVEPRRVTIAGNCAPRDLAATLKGAQNPLVVCDIEGGENEMLDPASCPELRSACILVELHEFCVRGITEIIRGRFEASHQITHIWEESRTLTDFPLKSPYLSIAPNYTLLDAMREWRPERMSWFWMVPRQDGGNAPGEPA